MGGCVCVCVCVCHSEWVGPRWVGERGPEGRGAEREWGEPGSYDECKIHISSAGNLSVSKVQAPHGFWRTGLKQDRD